jgi:hypothetical protein
MFVKHHNTKQNFTMTQKKKKKKKTEKKVVEEKSAFKLTQLLVLPLVQEGYMAKAKSEMG